MRLLIRRQSAEGSSEELFEGAEIVVGRATDCTISLPGLLVGLRHARLTQATESLFKLESLSPMGVELDGLSGVQTADVEVGDVLGIGGHRLRLSVAEDRTPVLEIELAEGGDALARRQLRSTLAEAGLRMRSPALLLVLITLLLGLALPLGLRLVETPLAVAAVVPTDHAWLSGAVSNAHRHFGNDCSSCHQTLFVPVRDEACLACHAGVRQHSDDPAILTTAGIEDRGCASCHREHQGDRGVVPAHPGLCADCHASPQRFTAFPDLKPVGDFGTDHPEFQPRADRSGLVFPHDVHMKTAGVRGPDGVETMQCESCHRRERGEAGFRPVAFVPDCQRCHQLDVEVSGTTLRLPHGDNELARLALSTAAKSPAPLAEPEEPTTRRRPGDPAPRRGKVGAAELIDDVIENRVCAKCHVTERPEGQAVRTRPVDLRQSWLVRAHFTHDAHAWQTCDDCHGAQSSARAEDLSLPDIASCRRCHAGVDSSNRLQSTCIDCHRFHEASRLVWGSLADGAEETVQERQP
jgi:hypothetical protein